MVPCISLIVPSRGRPEQLARLLASLAATAQSSENLEVIVVVDADDPATLAVAHDQLRIKRVVTPPGLSMGALNMAGYEAASGQLLMLLNDDVIARTPAWDAHVRTCFAA